MPATSASRLAVRGRLLVDGDWVDGALVVEGERVAEVVRGGRLEGFDGAILDGHLVAPGLIDLQVNGAFGVEACSAEGLERLAARLPETGVTGFLPTLVSTSASVYERVLAAAREVRGGGARVLGWHLEGPFLSAGAAGAHDAALVEAADDPLFERLLGEPLLSMVTLAPERPGALDRVRRLRERGVLVSVGHTAATFEQVTAAADAGAAMVTHLYSAMSRFHHRAPGAVGAALTDDRLTVGLIVDGVHCHEAAVRLAVRAKGPDRVALVSDAMAAAGLGDGSYSLMGRRVVVERGAARLEDGTLAGSVATLDEAVRAAVRAGAVSLAQALQMASAVPARLLGLERKGRLVAGADADLIVLDADGNVELTIVAGAVAFRRA